MGFGRGFGRGLGRGWGYGYGRGFGDGSGAFSGYSCVKFVFFGFNVIFWVSHNVHNIYLHFVTATTTTIIIIIIIIKNICIALIIVNHSYCAKKSVPVIEQYSFQQFPKS